VKQPRTNPPLHALATLNDVTYVEAGRALAGRVLEGCAGSDTERIREMFRLLLARSPRAEEEAVLQATLRRLRKEFAADPEAAGKFLDIGDSSRNPQLDPVEHAAFAALAVTLFNLDEALTKE
jgi:hypothetical protein